MGYRMITIPFRLLVQARSSTTEIQLSNFHKYTFGGWISYQPDKHRSKFDLDFHLDWMCTIDLLIYWYYYIYIYYTLYIIYDYMYIYIILIFQYFMIHSNVWLHPSTWSHQKLGMEHHEAIHSDGWLSLLQAAITRTCNGVDLCWWAQGMDWWKWIETTLMVRIPWVTARKGVETHVIATSL